MSNEPKWNILRSRDADGNKEYILTNKTDNFFFEENPPPFGLMTLLNRLESENAELRERLNTPRTDADGLNRLTNEQIDAMFPESMVERYYTQRQAARQVRDLLQGKEGERNA